MANNFESMSFADQLANTLPFQAGAASLQDQLAAAQAREAELMADNARLREALTKERDLRVLGQSPECGKIHWESIRDMRRDVYRQTDGALAATPEQSLARIRNQVREECAAAIDNGHPVSGCAAAVIRAMKEPE